MDKVKLEVKASPGDRDIIEYAGESYVWVDWRSMQEPLIEITTDVKQTVVYEVISVDERGIIEVKQTQEDTRISRRSDRTQPETTTSKFPPDTFKITKTGRIIRENEEYKPHHPQNPLMDIGVWMGYIMRQIGGGFPDGEVKSGDAWTVQRSIKSPDGRELKATIDSKLFAIGKLGDRDCAWIQTETKLPFAMEFRGDFERYSYLLVEGTSDVKIMSLFAYNEGTAIKVRMSSNLDMSIKIGSENKIAKLFIVEQASGTSTISRSK